MGTWTAVAEAYRRSFATLCSGTLDRLPADTCGRRHLDVGCGTGELAARAVADGRAVVATDADPDMVAITRTAHPSVLQAALPDLPFDDGRFDVVTANFVVNHVPDPWAAMGELARLVRPGGRLAVTIWPAGPTSWGALVSGSFDAAHALPVASRRLSPELDFERSVDGLRQLAESAGGVATAGQTYLAQTLETRAAIEAELRHRAAATATDGWLRLPQKAAYVVATR